MRYPVFEYDDTFIYAPSALAYARGELTEGKAIGTAKESDLVLLDLDQSMDLFVNPEGFAKKRKSGSTVGKKKLKEVQARVEAELNALVTAFLAKGKKADPNELKSSMTKVMKVAWKQVYLAGVRAAGISTPGKAPVTLTDPNDEKWIKGAMAHEMKFLNGMWKAIVEGTWVMPLPRRIKMYADALESFYDSARVIGLPARSKIHWVIGAKKKDRKTVCHSCRYLQHHTPYTKKTLPTVPRSGLTICLTNCRDRLLIRMGEQNEIIALHQSTPTRGTHIKKLRKIKKQGHAKGILPDDLLESDGLVTSCQACGGEGSEDREGDLWLLGEDDSSADFVALR